MVFKAVEVEKALCKKGFAKRGGDHRFFTYQTMDGRETTIQTKISHSATDVDKYLISAMAKQCELSKVEFVNLIKCPLSRERYESILKDKCVI